MRHYWIMDEIFSTLSLILFLFLGGKLHASNNKKNIFGAIL